MLTLRYICWLYVAIVVMATLIDVAIGFATQDGVRTGTGCNFYDALLIGVECRGFTGAKVAEGFLNWPLLLVYAPIFTFSSLWMLIPTVLLWLPPLYLLVGYVRRRYAT